MTKSNAVKCFYGYKRQLRLWLFLLFMGIACLKSPVSYGKNGLLAPVALQDTVIQLRKFDPAHIQEYKNDEDYLYDQEVDQSNTPSLWSRLKRWLFQKIFDYVFTDRSMPYWRWGLNIFCAFVIGYVILKLTNTNIRGLFTGKAKNQALQVSEGEENIHLLDFDSLIAEAIQKQQFTRAIRLFYLKLLKQLSDQDLINWQLGKTNHDYLRELKKTDIALGFSRLTSLFEYICYGDFPINTTMFEQARQEFKEFEEKVKRTS